jgi:septum formation protein
MRAYSDAEIDAYVATGDPMDKAGAYAIQHPGFHPVRRVERCYANVVGLPLGAVVRLLRDAGWDLSPDIPNLCDRHFGVRCEDPDEGELI